MRREAAQADRELQVRRGKVRFSEAARVFDRNCQREDQVSRVRGREGKEDAGGAKCV